jgi:hypothetical protein
VLLCKQEVAGSIPAGSIRRIPAIKRDSTRQGTRRRLRRAADGSVLEAFRSALADRSHSGRLACRRRAAAAPLASGNGGGAAGLTPHRTQKRRRGTSRSPTPRRRRSHPGRIDFAIVPARAVRASAQRQDRAVGARSPAGGVAKAHGQRAQVGLRQSSICPVRVAPRRGRRGRSGCESAAPGKARPWLV